MEEILENSFEALLQSHVSLEDSEDKAMWEIGVVGCGPTKMLQDLSQEVDSAMQRSEVFVSSWVFFSFLWLKIMRYSEFGRGSTLLSSTFRIICILKFHVCID
jgi:hypothetical protein